MLFSTKYFLCSKDWKPSDFSKNDPSFYSSSNQLPSVTIFHKYCFFSCLLIKYIYELHVFSPKESFFIDNVCVNVSYSHNTEVVISALLT